MRICYQSGVETGTAANYVEALKAHFRRVADESTEINFSGVPAGTWQGYQAAQASGYPQIFKAHGCPAFLDNAMAAEREGYDAFIVGAFTEPAVREIRSAVEIPVISALEATLLTACTVARRIGLIVPNEDVGYVVHLNVQEHRLQDRVAAIRVMSPELSDSDLNAAFDDPGPLLARFEETARLAIADHVDAVIPAEGIIAAIVARQGLLQVDGATVLDAIGIPILYAQFMRQLWDRTGLRPGRRWHYRKGQLGRSPGRRGG